MEFSVRDQPFDYEWRISGQDWDTVLLRKHNLRMVVAGMSAEELFSALREGTAPSDLPVIETWAEELEMKEVAEIIGRVKVSYDRPYIIFFPYGGVDSNQATITAFENDDKRRQYHIEYTLPIPGHKPTTDHILRLFRNPFGDWETDSNSGNYLLYTPIGEAIARKENLPPAPPIQESYGDGV